MPLCAHCNDAVLESAITTVWTDYPDGDYPGVAEEWCRSCAKSEDRDWVYDDAARKMWRRREQQ